MAVQDNIELWAGNDHSFSITVLDEDSFAVDITDITGATWDLKEDESSTTSLISKSLIGLEIQITHGDAGEYQVNLLPEDTEDLSGIYYWVSTITNISGLVYTTSYGNIYIHPEGYKTPSYCNLNDVRANLGTITVTEKTSPSSADVSVIINAISSEIKGILMGMGYDMPIVDPDALDYLKSVNIFGALSAFLKVKFPSDAGIGGDAGSSSFWENKYQTAIAQLSNPDFNLLVNTDDSTPTSGLYSGYYESEFLEEDLAYDYSEPFMRRDRIY